MRFPEEKDDENEPYPGAKYTGLVLHKNFNKYKTAQYFMSWFKNEYGGDIARVAYVCLPAGKEVKSHRDGTVYYRDKDRFHLVVSGQYEYIVNEEKQQYKAGDLRWFDNKKLHSSYNNGTELRIILIFDVKNSNWREVHKSELQLQKE